MAAPAQQIPPTPRGVHWSLPFVVVGLASLGGLWAIFGSLLTHPTAGVPGDPKRFDPIAAWPQVREYAGAQAKLVSFSALLVKPDGTMDLDVEEEPSPSAIYGFVRPVKGEPDRLESVTVVVAQPWRTVGTPEGGTYLCRGMDRTVGPSMGSYKELPEPRCSLGELWKQAIGRGADAGKPALVMYGPTGYAFTVQGTRQPHWFGVDCQPK